MTKKKIIITIVTLMGLILCTFSAYAINKNISIEKQLKATAENIDKSYDIFSSEKDRSKKIADLKSMVLKFNNDKSNNEGIEKHYSEKIKNMKLYFTNDYNKNLNLLSINSGTKSTLESQVVKLNSLLNTVKSERNVVLSNSGAYADYQSKINLAIKNSKVKINTMDMVAKAAAENEAKEILKAKTKELDEVALETKKEEKEVEENKIADSENSEKNSEQININYKTYASAKPTAKKVKNKVQISNKTRVVGGRSVNSSDYVSWYTQGGITAYYDEVTGQHWDTKGNSWTDNDLSKW